MPVHDEAGKEPTETWENSGFLVERQALALEAQPAEGPGGGKQKLIAFGKVAPPKATDQISDPCAIRYAGGYHRHPGALAGQALFRFLGTALTLNVNRSVSAVMSKTVMVGCTSWRFSPLAKTVFFIPLRRGRSSPLETAPNMA